MTVLFLYHNALWLVCVIWCVGKLITWWKMNSAGCNQKPSGEAKRKKKRKRMKPQQLKKKNFVKIKGVKF